MKKILSFVLTLAMILSLFAGLTVTASAENTGTITAVTEEWILLGGAEAITSAASAGTVAITMTTSGGTTFVLPNTKGASAAPTAIAVTVSGNTFTLDENTSNDDISWMIEAENDGYTIYNAVDPSTWLYSTNANNGVRVGNNTNKTWVIDSDSGYLKHLGTSRYLGVYSSQDWRAYTNTTGNTAGQTLQFWRLSSGTEPPAHEHDWSGWTPNGDSTHSRTCQAADCPIGTQTEACSFEDRVVTEPTCVDEGEMLHTCSVCGYSRAEVIPATGQHTDEDGDGLCDVCGQEMPTANTEYWYLIGGVESISGALDAGPIAITATLGDGSVFALSNTKGTGAAPTAVPCTAEDGYLTPEDAPNSDISWTIVAEGEGYTFYNAADPDTWLYSTNTNNGVRVGTNTGKTWVVDSESGYLKHVATGRYLGVYSSQDWRAYASATGNIAGQIFQFWKLVDEAPSHVHDWSGWTPNGDSTHSRTCQAADCPIGTQTEACSFEDRVVTEPTCGEEGELLHTCSVCGYMYTETTPATGQHTDENEDGFCDVCGQEMPEVVIYTLGTDLHEGDQVVIWSVSGNVALSTIANGKKLEGVSASISDGELTVTDDSTAVLTVRIIDRQNFRLQSSDGRYLTVPSNGSGLIFSDTADDNSLWYTGSVDSTNKILIVHNTNATYNGNNNQALQFYKDLFTLYTYNPFGSSANSFKFQFYIHAVPDAHVHDWTGTVTTEPTCTAKGVKTYTCSGCEQSYTEDIPMIPHLDEDGDGLCDACEGRIFSQAETLNDGDSLILVTGAFGVAMTGTASGNYMAAVEINAQEGVTVPVAADNIWTVKTADEGFYLVDHEGKYLYVNESNKLALGDEESSNILWTIGESVEGLEPTGTYLYNSGAERYLEYGKNYNNYQTYTAPTANYETCYAFTFYTIPAEPEPLDNGYYLLIAHGDDDWVIGSVDPGNKFELNGNAQDEWLLSTTLAVEDQIKVVRVENNTITGWWPNGEHTQYHVDEAHAGNVTIYFKTDYVDAWREFGGYFYIGSLLKPDTFADVYGCSISLKGNIALNFYVIPSEALLADENAYVALGDEQIKFSEAATRVVGEDTLYQFTVILHAKQMNDVVTLKVFDGEGVPVALYRHSNNEDVTGTGFSYSVHDYIQTVRENSDDQKLIDLVNAMADYGVLAQLQFNYNTEDLPEIQGDLDSVTAETLADYEAKVTEGTATGVSYKGTSLLLKSETVIRIYFTLDEGEIGDYTFKLGTKKVTPAESDDGWYIEVPNISAKDLDKVYTVNVSSAAGKIVTVKTSALSYVYKVLSTEGTSKTLVDLVKGIYLYAQAANVYFGK